MLNIVGKRKIFYVIAIFAITFAIVSFVVNKFQLDIELKGGTVIEADLGKTFKDADVEAIVKGVTGQTPVVQKMGKAGEVQTKVSIGTITLTDAQKNDIMTKLGEKYQVEDINAKTTFRVVSASFGDEMRNRAIGAVVVAIILIIIYLAITFKVLSGFSAGVIAAIALAHDITLMLLVYSLFGISINTTAVAAFLTILGYSVNDTVVIFDRIRENTKLSPRMPKDELVNLSINQSLRRTLLTSVTVIIALALLLGFGAYYRITSIQEFTIPLMVGIICGTFSSICITGNLWVDWNRFKDRKKAKKA